MPGAGASVEGLPKLVHLAAIWATAIGTSLSAYFILAANSWMQHPVGFRVNPDRGRAELTIGRVGLGTAALAFAFLLWTTRSYGDAWSGLLSALTAAALVVGLAANRREREGWAFALIGTSVVLAVASLFAALYPDVLPSTTNPAFSLTIENASSTPRTLALMSWVAVLMSPVVLAYEGWTYWVFRKRIGRESIPTELPHGAASTLGR